MSTLLEQIAAPAFLKKAWLSLNTSNTTSRGVSSETISDFAASLPIRIAEISRSLKSNTYEFNSVRAVLIPKKDAGEFRPLRIADVKDRLVQKALSIKIESLLSKKYKLDNHCSFAYQENKGIDKAIKQTVEHFQNGNRIILEADIKKFFDNVNRKKLLEKIYSNLKDQSINSLLENALNQSIDGIEKYESQYHYYFKDSINGIPQGNSLSPLLANIYLSDFDQKMIEQQICMVRYADDFIILTKTVKEAKAALAIAKQEIEVNLGLELHPLPFPYYLNESKTRIIDPYYHEFSFLSIRFDGKKLWVDPKKVKSLLEKLKDITDLTRYKNDKDFKGLITILKKIKNLQEGWLASYKFVDVDREFKEIDEMINFRLLQVLNKLELKIKTTHLNQTKIKGLTVQTLSNKQRENLGIPLCKDFIKTLKRDQIILS